MKSRALVLCLCLSCLLGIAAGSPGYGPGASTALSWHPPDGVLFTPHNTLILSGETDAAICRDFSVLIKNLQLSWVTVKTAALPQTIANQHIVVIGHLGTEPTLMSTLLTAAEIDELRQNPQAAVFSKPHPKNAALTLTVAAGSDQLLMIKAAEAVFTGMLAASPAGERQAWYLPALTASQTEATAYISRLAAVPDSAELPASAMQIDKDASLRRITAADAAADTAHFFSLLAHGWSGYGAFADGGNYAQAEAAIEQTLETRAKWQPEELAQLFHDQLAFIHDCHLNVGGHQYCQHQDFWYDTSLELWQANGTILLQSENGMVTVTAVNDQHPAPFIYPSLNAEGRSIYRLGLLSVATPAPLRLSLHDGQRESTLEVPLTRSDPRIYRQARQKFGETRIGGIPVLRVRSFGNHYFAELNEFLTAAGTYQGEPYLIVDIRGNPGGDDGWPKQWLADFTGQVPTTKSVWTELVSKTAMMGRINVCEEVVATEPVAARPWASGEWERRQAVVQRFEAGTLTPYWTPLRFPTVQRITNPTTLIIITDGNVGSAAEGLLSYVYRQVENVVVIGENSGGAVTFGQVSCHQLPQSKLLVHMPINMGIRMDLAWMEESGYFPDLWVPAEDALNYAVAAARQGTLTTQTPLPAGYFEAPFVPEKRPFGYQLDLVGKLVPIAWLLICAVIFSISQRQQRPLFLIYGAGWVLLGVIFTLAQLPVKSLLITYGACTLVIIVFLRGRQKEERRGQGPGGAPVAADKALL